jgi:hypothetical protein
MDTAGMLSAFLVLAVPIAITITKSVDFLRNTLDKADRAPKWIWNVAAFGIGIAYCLLFEVNFHHTMEGLHPQVAELMTGTWGQVVTGIGIGAMAGFWHEKLDEWSSIAKGRPLPPPTH